MSSKKWKSQVSFLIYQFERNISLWITALGFFFPDDVLNSILYQKKFKDLFLIHQSTKHMEIFPTVQKGFSHHFVI